MRRESRRRMELWVSTLVPYLGPEGQNALRACRAALRRRVDRLWMLGLLRGSLGPRVSIGGADRLARALRRLGLLPPLRFLVHHGQEVCIAYSQCAQKASITTELFFTQSRTPYELRTCPFWWYGKKVARRFHDLVNTRPCALAHMYYTHYPDRAAAKYGLGCSDNDKGVLGLLRDLVPRDRWHHELLGSLLQHTRLRGPPLLRSYLTLHMNGLHILRLRQAWRVWRRE